MRPDLKAWNVAGLIIINQNIDSFYKSKQQTHFGKTNHLLLPNNNKSQSQVIVFQTWAHSELLVYAECCIHRLLQCRKFDTFTVISVITHLSDSQPSKLFCLHFIKTTHLRLFNNNGCILFVNKKIYRRNMTDQFLKYT